MSIALEEHFLGISSPANLRINDQSRAFREACRRGGCNRPYHYVRDARREHFKRLSIETAGQLAKELLHVEHVALLPGDALLLPEDDFSFRCSYVDYNGEEVFQSWREKSPRTREDEDAFMRNHCPLIVDGVRYIGRYLEQIEEGRRPEHAA